MIGKEAIFNLKFKTEELRIDGLPEPLKLRELSGSQRAELEVLTVKWRDSKDYSILRDTKARMLAYCAIDAAGKRLFKDTDIKRLNDLPGTVLDKIFTVVNRLSGIKLGVENPEKN